MATEPNPMSEAVRRQIQRGENLLRQQLAEAASEVVREISEADFVRTFLPYFSGELKSTPQVLQAWSSVAGTPYSPVNIVANGVVVARVPPIAHTRGLRMRTDRSPVDGMMERAKQTASLHPGLANNNLAKGLGERFLGNEAQVDPTDRQGWITLLAHYGKTLQPSTPQTPAAPAADSSDYEYD